MAERILVVDDDAAFRGMLREALEARGWDVGEAGDAETGIRLVAEGGFDIVLHDVRLPGMDGIEALEHLHRWKWSSAAPWRNAAFSMKSRSCGAPWAAGALPNGSSARARPCAAWWNSSNGSRRWTPTYS
jgi:DNA-binding NarL/FixJ family response regulator